MEKITQPTIVVIVGISGDLASRYTLPALQKVAEAGLLPDKFKIIGVSRRDLQNQDVLPEGTENLAQYLELFQMDLGNDEDYQRLDAHLKQTEQSMGEAVQRLLYLSVPPAVTGGVIGHLGKAGLSRHPNTKLLLEKPFGNDLQSATGLVEHIEQYFSEDQVYRIDHYLAKEMAQNLLVFRSSNSLFRHTWNKDFIERIEIIAAEQIDIEGRAAFYEQTGALRDVVQSHLLQLAALTLMDESGCDSIPATRLQALQQLMPPADVAHDVVRGQYEGYRDQVNNPDSMVETYVSFTLHSKDPRWDSVPIIVTAGKALDQKTTEIRVHYRPGDCHEANELILHIQPDEGIEVRLWVKKPGYGVEAQQLPLDFAYKTYYETLPGAYERVFVDAMRGDHSLFATSEEVLESWRILEPIQHSWGMHETGLISYSAGAKPGDIKANAHQH